ncbi:Mitogen-activated protein kinase kinase kinase 1 [Acorus calamus]|uniref:mitogen-activated protein kinase kinase kinase n=1 Tax=Acorus calamus TaxID=4465 RepID=A0AAV9E5J7_ACOCL|nr:Mitogen-activated protein kinase kinase kinase 1 [Acorus calamus]
MYSKKKKNMKSPKPKLERRNAVKNIEYDPTQSSSSYSTDSSFSSSDLRLGSLRSRSLDLPPTLSAFTEQKSFRVEGTSEGEIDLLCRNLGLSGPEDFAIPVAAWEARKARCNSDLLPRSRSILPAEPAAVSPRRRRLGLGTRPPVLAPPPSMSLPAVLDKTSSTWDIFKALAPDADEGGRERQLEGESSSEEEEVENYGVGGVNGRTGETSAWNDDEDTSSTNTEGVFNISPIGRLKRDIWNWKKGTLLGSGSFGTVYDAINGDGFFFAVKEVSLLDQGNNAKQSIDQLEQEIALLSQFEHENIVQYLGTEKVLRKGMVRYVPPGIMMAFWLTRDEKLFKGKKAYTVNTWESLVNFFDANGSVKLADFGLAKQEMTINGLKSCKGSVYWMAPEPSALFKIGNGEPPPMPITLSSDARDFILKCIQVNPDARPSARALLNHPFVRKAF